MLVIGTHDVEDVHHWFSSPKRAEFFEARGMSSPPSATPPATATTAVLIEAPDMEALQAALAEPEAKEAEKHDGVQIDSLTLFVAE